MLGLLTGFALSAIMNASFPMPWVATFAALGTIVIVTIVSGLYPAVKAAALDPVEALRYE